MAREGDGGRLTTWAEIGAHIGRDARTAKRYELDRGLPVRRMPGSGKSTVYAFRAELDAWMRRAAVGDPPGPAAPAPPPAPAAVLDPPTPAATVARLPRSRRLIAGLGFAAAAVVAALLGASLFRRPPPVEATAAARDLYQQGVYAWKRRTPQGIRDGIDLFTQAIVRDPSYAEAYVGLADCYNLAPEFAGMAPADAYPRARAAAERAIALAPASAAAHRALAFEAFWWGEDVPRAFAEFQTSLKLDPNSSQTHHWFANTLAARADPRALDEINRTVALDPSTPVMTDKGWALIMLGRYAEAQAVLDQVARLDPDYPSVHQHLALLADRVGDTARSLREQLRTAELRHDEPAAAMARAGMAAWERGGRDALLRAEAEGQERLYAEGRTTAFRTALAESRMRRRARTLELLAAARAERDSAIVNLEFSPDFAWLRTDPAFVRVAHLA